MKARRSLAPNQRIPNWNRIVEKLPWTWTRVDHVLLNPLNPYRYKVQTKKTKIISSKVFSKLVVWLKGFFEFIVPYRTIPYTPLRHTQVLNTRYQDFRQIQGYTIYPFYLYNHNIVYYTTPHRTTKQHTHITAPSNPHRRKARTKGKQERKKYHSHSNTFLLGAGWHKN